MPKYFRLTEALQLKILMSPQHHKCIPIFLLNNASNTPAVSSILYVNYVGYGSAFGSNPQFWLKFKFRLWVSFRISRKGRISRTISANPGVARVNDQPTTLTGPETPRQTSTPRAPERRPLQPPRLPKLPPPPCSRSWTTAGFHHQPS